MDRVSPVGMKKVKVLTFLPLVILATASCMPENYILRSDHYRELERVREADERECASRTSDISDELDDLRADLAREEGRRLELEGRLEDSEEALHASLDRLDEKEDELDESRERLNARIAQLEEALDIANADNEELRAEIERLNSSRVETNVETVGRIYFGPASADLDRTAHDALDALIRRLAADTRAIHLMGHADASPISTPRFPSNWDLASSRAAACAAYLTSRGGIDPSRITVVGRGAVEPVSSNDTPEGRASNRRVEVWLIGP